MIKSHVPSFFVKIKLILCSSGGDIYDQFQKNILKTMFDLFLSLPVQTAQVQIIAQAQASTVYLSISTKQSPRPNCVTYTAKNSTGRRVRDVQVNRRNSQGKISKRYLTSSLAAGKATTFDMCDNSYVNVEARQ